MMFVFLKIFNSFGFIVVILCKVGEMLFSWVKVMIGISISVVNMIVFCIKLVRLIVRKLLNSVYNMIMFVVSRSLSV